MIDNPRYPHSILIAREQLDSNGTPIFDENGDPEKITIASSECGLRGLSEIDINSGIAQTDVKVSIPLPTTIWNIKVTDDVVFTNGYTGEKMYGRVSKYDPRSLGINLYFKKNG